MAAYVPPGRRENAHKDHPKYDKEYPKDNSYAEVQDPLAKIKSTIMSAIGGDQMSSHKKIHIPASMTATQDTKEYTQQDNSGWGSSRPVTVKLIEFDEVVKLVKVFSYIVKNLVDATVLNEKIKELEKAYKKQFAETKTKMKFIPTTIEQSVAKNIIISPHRSYFTSLSKIAKELNDHKTELDEKRTELLKLLDRLSDPTSILNKLGCCALMWLDKMYLNGQTNCPWGWSASYNKLKFDLHHQDHTKIYTVYSTEQYNNIKAVTHEACTDITNTVKRVVDTSVVLGIAEFIEELEQEARQKLITKRNS